MSERVHHHDGLIFSPGTQVVSLVEVLSRSGRTLHPRGAVCVVVESPCDLQHSYLVRFLGGFEASLRPVELMELDKFRLGTDGHVAPFTPSRDRTQKSRIRRTIYPWNVQCIDLQSRQPFDRQLLFDEGLCANDEERQLVEEILGDSKRHSRLSKYRHVFREVTRVELMREWEKCDSIATVGIDNYFEDRDGHPLDEIEWLSIMSGQVNPVIMGNVSSVLRLGLSAMRNTDKWTVAHSNDLVHFLQVVGILQRSRWWQSSAKLSGNSIGGPFSLENPDLDSTTAALALIRQFLLPRDNVFREAVKLYVNHVDNDAKRAWVSAELEHFNKYLLGNDRMPAPEALARISNQDLIEVVVYGTGLFHRESRDRLEEKLTQVTRDCPREELMFAFDMACRQMLSPPFTVAPLLYRDFAHWSSTGLCPRPTRVVTSRLFAGDAPIA